MSIVRMSMLLIALPALVGANLDNSAAGIAAAKAAGATEQLIGSVKSVAVISYWNSIPSDPKQYTVDSGTILVFYYDQSHDVWSMITSAAFDSCSFGSALLLAGSNYGSPTPASGVNNKYEVVVTGPKTLYFACSVSSHCLNGQKITVVVRDPAAADEPTATPTTAAPTPAPTESGSDDPSPTPAPAPTPTGPTGSDNPCFGRSTTACRLQPAQHGATRVTAPEAFEDCYGPPSASSGRATRVPMTDLVSGDAVLAMDKYVEGALSVSRVLFNQHRFDNTTSGLLRIHHERGWIDVTQDHLLLIDGRMQAASEATRGATLTSPSVVDGTETAKAVHVTRVSSASGHVINPMTDGGLILAAGPDGMPIVASVYGGWYATHLAQELDNLSREGRTCSSAALELPLRLCCLFCTLFPSSAQAFYDAVAEPLFPVAGSFYPTIGACHAVLPTALWPLGLCLFDMVFATAFAAHSFLRMNLISLGLAAVAAASAWWLARGK